MKKHWNEIALALEERGLMPIVADISRKNFVTVHEVLSGRTTKKVVETRHKIVIHFLSDAVGFSTKEVAEVLSMDLSTIFDIKKQHETQTKLLRTRRRKK